MCGVLGSPDVHIFFSRVSYDTQFILEEPNLEPKPVSTPSKTKKLVLIVSRNSETVSFEVSVELKLTTLDAKQL